APMGTPGLLEALAEIQPRNPFCTLSWFKTKQELGAEPWIVGLRDAAGISSAGGVFLRRGLIGCDLEIASLPDAAGEASYWQGLFRFCRARGITRVEAQSYASSSVEMPSVVPD